MELTIFHPDIIIQIAIFLFTFSFLLELVYHLVFTLSLSTHKPVFDKQVNSQGASVIIVSRNKAHLLKHSLPYFLEQDYPSFEVIVVNNVSDDETKELVEDLSLKYSNLRQVNLTQELNFFSEQKFALALGIKAAEYDHIVFSNPDCKPDDMNWLMKTMSQFGEGKEIVLGFRRIIYNKGFFNVLARIDQFLYSVKYLSMASLGKAYRGVGENMAIRKSLFFEQKGFSSQYNIKGGENEIFIQQTSTKQNTAISVGEHAGMEVWLERSFKSWISEVRNRMKGFRHYKPRLKFLMRTFSFFHFTFYLSIVYLLINQVNWEIVLIALAIKYLLQVLLLKNCVKRLNESLLLVFSPLLEPVFILIKFVLGLVTLFRKGS